jgi:hypothetical protein
MHIHERYEAAAHRVQTAVGMVLHLENPWMDDRLGRVLKHIRVGVDLSKADHGALVSLLIKKGVFSEAEYFEATVSGTEREAEMQQETLQKAMRKGNPDLTITTL